MPKVFISYRRKGEDQVLASTVYDKLTEAGLEVFIDRNMAIGTRWAEEIKREVLSSDFFVLLISEESVNSDMVREELRLAYHRCKEGGSPVILPIRLRYHDELPYDLNAKIGPINYGRWSGPEDDDRVVELLIGAITKQTKLPQVDPGRGLKRGASPVSEPSDATFPPRLETGAMAPDSPFYVARNGEDQVWNVLTGVGGAVTLFAPRQLGKSSFLRRLESRLASRGDRVVVLDFQLLAAEPLDNVQDAYLAFAELVSEEMGLDLDAGSFFARGKFPSRALLKFLREGVLANRDDDARRIVFLMDEVDDFFDKPIANDFFAGFRYILDQKSRYADLHSLAMAFAYAENPAFWLKDPNQSPFRGSIAHSHHLQEFDLANLSWLNRRHPKPVLASSHEEEGILSLLGGHPGLSRIAFYHLATGACTYTDLKAQAHQDEGPFCDHLRSRLLALLRREKLAASFHSILKTGSCSDERQFQSLRAMGLVKGKGHRDAAARCAIYSRYFDGKL